VRILKKERDDHHLMTVLIKIDLLLLRVPERKNLPPKESLVSDL